jgi:chromate reductase
MATYRVAVLVGSLRKEAFSRRVAQALCAMQPASLQMEIVEIAMPLYNQDLETDTPPAEWTAYRDKVRAAQALLIVTPEYNRGMTAAIKNAIDVGSRPYGKAAINGKPCAVASTSPGALGGFGANHQVRQSVVFLDMPMMPAPELYVGHVDKMVEAGGKVANEGTRELFGKFLDRFADFVQRNAR